MKAIFIRHKLANTPEIIKDLWDKRLIAVHFGNIASTNPNDFEGPGKKALKRLWKYCESGVIVGASYRDFSKAKMLVGEIPKGSNVELWESNGYIYKTVQLRNVQEVSYQDYPLLAAIHPPFGTLTGWPSAEKYLNAILGKGQIPWEVQSLHPSQLEVICAEFLRMKNILQALDIPVGKTLPDVDIFGIGEVDETIIAQVTHSSNQLKVENKLNTLKKYQQANTQLIFFGPEKCRIDDSIVQYIANEQVFKALDENKPLRRLLEKMLRWKAS
ncbi:MAG: hypothetical protein FVQ83_01535 [Chloroflexi bacterium]|nr:hypothetical protein [Chloroflexota bacterium]